MASSEFNSRGNQAGHRGAYHEESTTCALNLGKERTAGGLGPFPSGEARPAFQSQQPPQNVSVDPITTATVSSFRRIISLLLPIRYPEKFFAESTANPTPSSLARVAIWHERPRPAKRKLGEKPQSSEEASLNPDIPPSSSSSPPTTQSDDITTTVVGGIQCRFEQLPFHPSLIPSSKRSSGHPRSSRKYCYIQTLALLSPYRSKGIGTALLEAIITTLCTDPTYEGTASIYAHVWEANEDALEWYAKRGFQVGDMVQGYYTRLKPAGAKIVWRDLGVKDCLLQQSR
ncbi:MAG: hypothetical protein LQ343_000776 [Gyalolechia ehrenbergii]|nr:MAG: hypothetical protein LQ343_000776 [Gyalolechia ehrenbergii]